VGKIEDLEMTTENQAAIEHLRRLEGFLRSGIIGQDDALGAISRVIVRCELGYTSPDLPKANFALFGPTGVGKTETCLMLAEHLHGDRQALLRFDMSEFMLMDTAPVFLDRMQFLTAGREKTGGILLFDEMEKAHPRILDFFLQILSAARLTYSDHSTGLLHNFYIVFTSNLGSEILAELRSSRLPYTVLEKAVLSRASSELRPEFFGRLQNKIVYRKLDPNSQREIAGLLLNKETKRWGVGHDTAALELMVRRGTDPRYGARPMRNTVESHVRDALAAAVMQGGNPTGSTLSGNDRKLFSTPATPPEGEPPC
jgi:ATP-dependent Clp protease ATP-binding subunit ClpB